MQDISQDKEHPAKTLVEVIQTDDPAQIEVFLADLKRGEEARAVAELDKGQQTRLLELLGPEKSAELLLKTAGRGSAGFGHR